MSARGTQAQTTAKPEGSAIRAPESKPANHQQAPVENAVLGLQGGLGNRATAGLLRNGGVLQASLRIGPADGRYEREANRMADRVMQAEPGFAASETSLVPAAPAPVQRTCSDCEDELQREPLAAVSSVSELRVQRVCTECEEELEEEDALQREAKATTNVDASPALESRVSSLRGRGSPLSPAQRGFFEPRLGHDFGGVRLHTGPAASDAARLARARAFTVGRDIAFGAGEYRPETRSGRRLLAHELTHVVQQTPRVARRKPLLQRQAETQDVAPAPEPEEPTTEQALVGPEAGSEESPETRAQAPGLLVEDATAELGPGQMTRAEFLAATRAAVCAAADTAFAGTEFTAQGCPYVELVLRFYENRSAERIESDLASYLPAAAGAASASDYIPLIANRVRQSVETFVATGAVTGIPEGVPGSLTALVEGASSVGGVFFKARDGGPRGSADPSAVQAQLGAGRPLGGSVRSRMQSAFGHSFSGVKVHTGSTASRLSNRFNARAFTVGNHVAFGSGEYRPGTPIGDALVAHELAHVVQQRGASDSVAPLQSGTAATGALERDADRSAAGAVASLWRGAKDSVSKAARNAVPSLRSGLSIQRCPSTPSTSGPSSFITVLNAPANTADCGGARSRVKWTPSGTTPDGAIIQHIRIKYSATDCAGTVQPSDIPGDDIAYWEAWEVKDGKVWIGWKSSGNGEHGSDTLNLIPFGSGTKGVASSTGKVTYLKGYNQTTDKGWGTIGPAGSLPARTTAPTGWAGATKLDHWLRAEWNCCPASDSSKWTKTKVTGEPT